MLMEIAKKSNIGVRYGGTSSVNIHKHKEKSILNNKFFVAILVFTVVFSTINIILIIEFFKIFANL